MGNVVWKKFRIYQFILILLIGVLTCMNVIVIYHYRQQDVIDEQKLHINLNTTIIELEEYFGNEENQDRNQAKLPKGSYAIIDLSGNIIYSNLPEYHTKEKISLHRFGIVTSQKDRYQTPLVYNDKQFGTAVIRIHSDLYRVKHKKQLYSACVIIAGVLIGSILLLIVMRRYLKEDILIPIDQIHQATIAIMAGDYSVSVRYDYDGEMGGLCHDFELMRTELKDCHERETQYKKKETLLLASISHDLKTPLATVENYAEGILYDVVETKEGIKEYAAIIISKISYLTGLINDILEHSKAGLNQFQIEKEDVYANLFFDTLFKELGKEVKDRSFDFQYEQFPSLVVSLDKRRITQVFRNLVDNSLKYGNPGGYIRVTNKIIDKIVDGKKKSYLCIAFEDNGCGISATDLPYIFETFYRGDKARNQEIKGSGLGLNIAKYIINCHDGDITCDSNYGQGTTMNISIAI